MSGFRFSFPACVIAGKGRIMSDDILTLRKYAFPDGIRFSEEADILFALNASCPEPSPEWATYFVESLSAYVVRNSGTAGVIDDKKSRWLQGALSRNGAIRFELGLELLLHAMEIANEVEESLSAFALDQLRLALQPQPRGAYASLRPPSPGVSEFDLAYVWRVLRPALVRGRLMLSPLEAEVLRKIDHLAPTGAHHAAWQEMIGMMMTLDRPDDPLRNDRWLAIDNRSLLDEELAA